MKLIERHTSNLLKAILPFGIIATHYLPLYGYDTLYLGEIIVALFFFMSGYGLSVSKKKVTMHLFVQRISKLIIPFTISILLFQFVTLAFGKIAILKVPYCKNFTDAIGMILPNFWFVYSIVIFYTIFHIINHIIKKDGLKYTTLFLLMMLYIKLMSKYVPGEHWHITSLAFFSGTLYKEIQDKRVKQDWQMIYFLIMLVATLTSFLIKGFYSRLLFFALIPFAICSILSYCHFNTNKIISFFYNISYPMYLLHGITIYIVNLMGDILSLYTGFILIIAITIPMAYMVYNLDNKIRAKYFF